MRVPAQQKAELDLVENAERQQPHRKPDDDEALVVGAVVELPAGLPRQRPRPVPHLQMEQNVEDALNRQIGTVGLRVGRHQHVDADPVHVDTHHLLLDLACSRINRCTAPMNFHYPPPTPKNNNYIRLFMEFFSEINKNPHDFMGAGAPLCKPTGLPSSKPFVLVPSANEGSGAF